MVMTMACILLSTACGVIGQLLLKKAMTNMGVITPTAGGLPAIVLRIATSPLVIFGLSCYVLGSFFWLIALSRTDLSFAYPFASLSYILIFAGSWYFFGEHISTMRLSGLAVIVLGVLLVARS
jgi:drug/metabolite transporter (DMT)-like permease